MPTHLWRCVGTFCREQPAANEVPGPRRTTSTARFFEVPEHCTVLLRGPAQARGGAIAALADTALGPRERPLRPTPGSPCDAQSASRIALPGGSARPRGA